ncbi:MAG: helix-turn-helix transcriptional regulator, partial [Bryobacteraceae bacterium]
YKASGVGWVLHRHGSVSFSVVVHVINVEYRGAECRRASGEGALVFKIDTIMRKQRMKQTEAAALFGVRQPDISKMLRGEFRQFSVERLLRFLVKLDQDVEIVVRPHRDRHNAPALHVS